MCQQRGERPAVSGALISAFSRPYNEVKSPLSSSSIMQHVDARASSAWDNIFTSPLGQEPFIPVCMYTDINNGKVERSGTEV